MKYFGPNCQCGIVEIGFWERKKDNSNCTCLSSLLRRRSSWRSRRGRTTLQSMDRGCACTGLRRRRSWSSRGFLRAWEGSSGCSSLVRRHSQRTVLQVTQVRDHTQHTTCSYLITTTHIIHISGRCHLYPETLLANAIVQEQDKHYKIQCETWILINGALFRLVTLFNTEIVF